MKLVFDYDGTLVGSDYIFDKRLTTALRQLRQEGFELYIISSRDGPSLREALLDNDVLALFEKVYAENGFISCEADGLVADEVADNLAAGLTKLHEYMRRSFGSNPQVDINKKVVSLSMGGRKLSTAEIQRIEEHNSLFYHASSSGIKHEFYPHNMHKNDLFFKKHTDDGGGVVYVADSGNTRGNDRSMLYDERVQWGIEVRNESETLQLLTAYIKCHFDMRRTLNQAKVGVVTTFPRRFQANSRVSSLSVTEQYYILSDYDGTVTREDQHISSAAVEIMECIHKNADDHFIVLTGRSKGWCDKIIHVYSIDAIVGENGAFVLYRKPLDDQVYEWTNPLLQGKGTEHRRKEYLEELSSKFDIVYASDQPFRQYDIAIKKQEDGYQIDPATLREVVDHLKGDDSVTWKESNVHINIWFAKYDKATALVDFLCDELKVNYVDLLTHGSFCGDSRNDECMFRMFPMASYGVNTVKHIMDELTYHPTHILDSSGDAGFVEYMQQVASHPTMPFGDKLFCSVVIPIFNDPLKVRNTLLSICQAASDCSEGKVEVILVDNNSKNCFKLSLLAIVNEVEALYPSTSLSLLFQHRLQHTFSLCLARNKGVSIARGKWVLMTDSDCMMEPSFFTEMLAFLRQRCANSSKPFMVTGVRKFVQVPEYISDPQVLYSMKDFKEQASDSNYGKVTDRRVPFIFDLPQQEHPWSFVHGCFIFLTRDDYEHLKGMDEHMDGVWGYEDTDFAFRFVTHLDGEILCHPTCCVYHQEKEHKVNTRFDKSTNQNWKHITKLIPGFENFKKRQFEKCNIEMK